MSAALTIPTIWDQNESWATEQFAKKARENLRFSKGWFHWDGKRWTTRGAEVRAHELAKEFARDLYALAATAPHDQAPPIAKLAGKLLQRNGLMNVLALGEHERLLHCEFDEFDADRNILNVANGILDLKSLKLHPHHPDGMCTKLAGAPYEPAAKCDRWVRFMDEIFEGDQETISYVQRLLGYCLTGHVNEQKFFFLCGGGKNGKSTFVEVIDAMLGDYACKVPGILLTASLQERNSSSALSAAMETQGRRFCYVSELPRQAKWDEENVKGLTGDGKIKARQLYQRYVEFNATAKLVVAANHRPRSGDDSVGFWRRMHLIPFDYEVPEGQRDPRLLETLTNELPGILAWCVEGLREWNESGLGDPPTRVKNATLEYQTEEDTLGDWFKEHYEADETGRIAATEIYARYLQTVPPSPSRLSKSAFRLQPGKKIPTLLGAGFTERGGTKYFHVRLRQGAKGAGDTFFSRTPS